MGYYVDYSAPVCKREDRDSSFLRVAFMAAAFFAAFCLYVSSFWPQGKEALQKFLFPGSNASTRQAAEVFVSELQNGEAIGDALENFCREILDEADIP